MPDFTDPRLFPSFYELPPAPASSDSPPSPAGGGDGDESPWYLLAQVKENMTITQPTLIVTDRTGVDFALLFEDRGKNLKSFKKTYTVVIPRARRTDREEVGKKGIVRVEKGDGEGVKVISGRLARVLELGKLLDSGALGKRCGSCGKGGGTEDDGATTATTLSRCLGCGIAVYCSKECQAVSWNELDHKSNCKVLRAVETTWS
ncbi:hypothetical protein Micbo1qcDRAFT_197712 [Microdochium bolleyi]|uniref:MYND-type domain-containing protein n=1 Tax=Microdochium bolleyi TaxID=196109 RepID=A0A136ISF7_9PEZI|nr:hypothetical protein Micbo1qcDRAFT_197712 [Microdochium bolleyi]